MSTSNFFNIIIRTSSRPNYFKNCIKSVMNQTYKDFYVYIIYDNESDMTDYLESYNDLYSEYLTFFEVNRLERRNEKHFPYNDYLNNFFDNEDVDLKEGFIIILDDDCRFTDDNSLYNLNKNINDLGTTDNPSDNFYMFKCQIGNSFMPANSLEDGLASDGDIYICGLVIHTDQIFSDKDIIFEENINAVDNILSTMYSKYNGIYIDECYVYTDLKGNGMRNDLVINKIKFKIPEKEVKKIERIEQIENENKISENIINEITKEKKEEIKKDEIKKEEIAIEKIAIENSNVYVEVQNQEIKEQIVEIKEEIKEVIPNVEVQIQTIIENEDEKKEHNDEINNSSNYVNLMEKLNNVYLIDKTTLSSLFNIMNQLLKESNVKDSEIKQLQSKISELLNNKSTYTSIPPSASHSPSHSISTNVQSSKSNTENDNSIVSNGSNSVHSDNSTMATININNNVDIYLLVKNNLNDVYQASFVRNSKILEKGGISWNEYGIKDNNYYKHIKEIINLHKTNNTNNNTNKGLLIMNGTELFNYNMKTILQKIIDSNPNGYVLFGNSIDMKDVKSLSFNWDLYLKMYPDIANAKMSFMKEERGKSHWNTFGLKEFRPANIGLIKSCNLIKDTFCGIYIANTEASKAYLELYDKNRNFTLFDIKNNSKDYKLDTYSVIPELCIPTFTTDSINIKRTICMKNNWYLNFYC